MFTDKGVSAQCRGRRGRSPKKKSGSPGGFWALRLPPRDCRFHFKRCAVNVVLPHGQRFLHFRPPARRLNINSEKNNTRRVFVMEEVVIRLRMGSQDAHYGGNLVDGAHMLALFGDVATELLIRRDGDEGLFRAYEEVEFLGPVYAGDYIEARGEIIQEGNTSRKMRFEAKKVIRPRPDISESACDVLEEPIVVCRAVGTCVTPKDKQRR